jgi:hypothetical protein
LASRTMFSFFESWATSARVFRISITSFHFISLFLLS